MKISRHFGTLVFQLLLPVMVLISSDMATAKTAEKTPVPSSVQQYEAALKGTKRVATGLFSVYSKNDKYFFTISKDHLGRLMLWYSEAVKLPTQALTISGNRLGSAVVKWERRGNRLLLRNLTPTFAKRAKFSPVTGSASHGEPVAHPKLLPIERAIEDAAFAPIILAFKILGENEAGNLLIDVSSTFSKDIPEFSAKLQLAVLQPTAIDGSRSYIDTIKAFPTNVLIRSVLTFALKPNMKAPGGGTASIEVAHSIVLLPDNLMRPRYFDRRVGYFASQFAEFEPENDVGVINRKMILRYRLEKANPDAAVSKPIKPIIYYIGRGVPDKWRPYIKQGIEDWKSAFEKAGFSEAIIARQAPSVEEDPNWDPSDARHSVVRWIAQPIANAMGPNLHDPRTGEIISSHILIWAKVLKTFGNKYFAMVSAIDPDARTLPLNDELLGRILRYVVSHEVGHTLGLRHNHKASTAYTIKQLRDPAFTNRYGSVASIMSYGRFNYVAQPEDGVTQLFPIVAPYDYFAINWGYRPIPDTQSPDDEFSTLDEWASKQITNPWLKWAAGEMPDEVSGKFDPTVISENIGSDRLEATRLGILNVHRALAYAKKATARKGQDYSQLKEVYDELLNTQQVLLGSVTKMVGGVIEHRTLTGRGGAQFFPVPMKDQRAAVRFLLSDAIDGYSPFLDPDLIKRIRPIGGALIVEDSSNYLLKSLFNQKTLALLNMHAVLTSEDAYSIQEFVSDVTEQIWSHESAQTSFDIFLRRGLQRAYLDQIKKLLGEKPDTNNLAGLLQMAGIPEEQVAFAVFDSKNTLFPAIARGQLRRLEKDLNSRLIDSDDKTERLHFADMLRRVRAILELDKLK